MGETLGSAQGRPVLRMERMLGHPPERVWRALTEAKELSQWYPFRAVELELRVGGVIRFEDEDGTGHEAVVTEVEPTRVFAFRVAEPGVPGGRESDNRLRFELRPERDGCLLIFTYVFADRAAAGSYATGWQRCLDAMERVLAGEPVAAPDMSVMVERHEAFVEKFGLNRGTVTQTPHGWQVRFERQLMMREVGEAWVALPAGEGQVTVSDAPKVLEYVPPAGGRVRWELSEGPGGARVELTVTGGPGQDADTACDTWRDRVEALAARLRC